MKRKRKSSIFDKITIDEYIAKRRKIEAQMAHQELNLNLACAKQHVETIREESSKPETQMRYAKILGIPVAKMCSVTREEVAANFNKIYESIRPKYYDKESTSWQDNDIHFKALIEAYENFKFKSEEKKPPI